MQHGLGPRIYGRHRRIVWFGHPIAEIASFSPLKNALQKLGSWVVRKASGTDIPDAPRGFRAYHRDIPASGLNDGFGSGVGQRCDPPVKAVAQGRRGSEGRVSSLLGAGFFAGLEVASGQMQVLIGGSCKVVTNKPVRIDGAVLEPCGVAVLSPGRIRFRRGWTKSIN